MSYCEHDGEEFTVTWTVQVSAPSPEAAARKALELQRDYRSTARVFTVQMSPREDGTMPFKADIDLHEGTVTYPGGSARALYYTADGEPITLGGIYWDSSLELVRVTEINNFTEHNYNTHEDVTWHRAKRIDPTTGGGISYDGSSLAVRHPFDGRLATEAAAALGIAE